MSLRAATEDRPFRIDGFPPFKNVSEMPRRPFEEELDQVSRESGRVHARRRLKTGEFTRLMTQIIDEALWFYSEG